MKTSRPPLAVIAGPTASGKSALGLRLAEEANGVIINADSAQVYRDLRVLTARPSQEDEVRAPHRLYGYLDGAESCSAARWAADAQIAIEDAHRDDRLPILVGGTGLYIRTLLDGIAPIPAIDPAIRAEVRSMTVVAAYAALAAEDAPAATRLASADTTRVARALEVVRSTGRSLAEWQTRRAGGVANSVALMPFILLPDRADLLDRIDARAMAMFQDGAIAEVEALNVAALPIDAPVRRVIGVREIGAMLAGETDRDAALERLRTTTRQYAKRQYTWFRNQPPIHWSRGSSAPTVLKEYFDLCR